MNWGAYGQGVPMERERLNKNWEEEREAVIRTE